MVIFVEHGTLSLAAPLCACASIAAAALLCVLLVLLVLLVLAVLTALNDYRTVCFVVLMRATRAAGCRLNHVLCSSRVAVRGRSNTWRCGAVRPRGLAVQCSRGSEASDSMAMAEYFASPYMTCAVWPGRGLAIRSGIPDSRRKVGNGYYYYGRNGRNG